MENGGEHQMLLQQSTAGAGLLAGIRWTLDQDQWLSSFVEHYTLPHLAIVTKGQYKAVGAPIVASPHLKPYVLLHSRQRERHVLAALLTDKHKHSLRLGGGAARLQQTNTAVRLAVPESYAGFFEIVSEDGRAPKCLESVKELHELSPEQCLVRQKLTGYLPEADGQLCALERSRQVLEGELLTLCGLFNLHRQAFLRCFDANGQSVYLKMSAKGKFSAVAKREAYTGVHSVRNLIDSKRLPLTVRLVHHSGAAGGLPASLLKGASQQSGGIHLRLLSVFHSDVVMVFVLQKDWEFLSVPLNAHLKLAPSSNHPQIASRPEFQQLCEQCEQLLPQQLGRITQVTEQVASSGQVAGAAPGQSPSPKQHLSAAASDSKLSSCAPICDDEIDLLYDYIRGLGPLPDLKSAPAPPPLTTLPRSRKSCDSSQRSEQSQHIKPSAAALQQRKAEQRLDHVIRNGGGSLHQRLSKSNDRLLLGGAVTSTFERVNKHPRKQRPISVALTPSQHVFYAPPQHSHLAPAQHLAKLQLDELELFEAGLFPPPPAPVYLPPPGFLPPGGYSAHPHHQFQQHFYPYC